MPWYLAYYYSYLMNAYTTTPASKNGDSHLEEEMTNIILNILKGGTGGGDGGRATENKTVIMHNEFQVMYNSNFTININVP